MSEIHFDSLLKPHAMRSQQEQFSDRLQQALANAHFSPKSPTRLAREFNVRFPDYAITVHAARKWLVGEAIPTQGRLIALAKWLNVSASSLRYGSAVELECAPAQPPEQVRLLNDIARLDAKHKALVRERIRMLLRTQNDRP